MEQEITHFGLWQFFRWDEFGLPHPILVFFNFTRRSKVDKALGNLRPCPWQEVGTR